MATTALIHQPESAGRLQLLRPIADPVEVIQAQNATRELVHQALKDGRDFGVIPGTDKPTMLKPGAERVALAFGCYYGSPEILEKEIDHDRGVQWVKQKWVTKEKPTNHEELKARGVGRNRKFGEKWVWQERTDERGVSLGLYRYVVRVPVVNRATGEVVGSGLGSCSSMEAKYVDRPRDCENTVLKMAHKRAMVAACLITFGLSDEFTQDVEDMPHIAGDDSPRAEASAPSANGQPARQASQSNARTNGGAATTWPFGDDKGKTLASLESDNLESKLAWCRKKGKTDLADAIVAILDERDRAQPMREYKEDDVSALEDGPDELPF